MTGQDKSEIPRVKVILLVQGVRMYKELTQSQILRRITLATGVVLISLGSALPAQAAHYTSAPLPQTPMQGPLTPMQSPLSCEEGGECEVGDIGPGGGVVFYVLDSSVKSGWRYLEASPDGWNDGDADPKILWCTKPKVFVKSVMTGNTPAKSITSGLIGLGVKNTQAIVGSCAQSAASISTAYRGGGYSNWSLPSKEELKLMFKNKALIGGFSEGVYWSSTEVAANYAGAWSFINGSQLFTLKDSPNFVRPIRSF